MAALAYAAHPAAEIFGPILAGDEMLALRTDIADHGLRVPITLHEGKILDGRNRYAACRLAGVEPRFEEWSGTGSPIEWVLSLNLHRRHLDASQRAMVGARAMPQLEAEAKERQRRGGREKVPVNLPEAGDSRDKAAALVNVSGRSIDAASAVQERASPELVASVWAGKIAVSAAADLLDRSHEVQAEIVRKVESGEAKNFHAAKNELNRSERVERLAEISKGSKPLDGVRPAPILYADPPWRYEHVKTESRAIENQYPTMALEEICALGPTIPATPDAVLFLWATSPKLAEAMEVLRAWGFSYRTCAVWDKEKIGMGYYFRQQHELLLVATRGSPPTPAPADRPSSVVRVARGKHSAKPAEFAGLIEAMYPELPKVELFSRTPRAGWVGWGNQAA